MGDRSRIWFTAVFILSMIPFATNVVRLVSYNVSVCRPALVVQRHNHAIRALECVALCQLVWD